MEKNKKVTEVVSEILEEVTGGMEFDEDFDLSELDLGFEDLLACTKHAFNLPDNWTDDGSKVNSSLTVFIEFVCSKWTGSEINNDWRSASELLGG